MKVVAYRPAHCNYETSIIDGATHAEIDRKAEEWGAVRIDKGTHIEVLLYGEWFCLPKQRETP